MKALIAAIEAATVQQLDASSEGWPSSPCGEDLPRECPPARSLRFRHPRLVPDRLGCQRPEDGGAFGELHEPLALQRLHALGCFCASAAGAIGQKLPHSASNDHFLGVDHTNYDQIAKISPKKFCSSCYTEHTS